MIIRFEPLPVVSAHSLKGVGRKGRGREDSELKEAGKKDSEERKNRASMWSVI